MFNRPVVTQDTQPLLSITPAVTNQYSDEMRRFEEPHVNDDSSVLIAVFPREDILFRKALP